MTRARGRCYRRLDMLGAPTTTSLAASSISSRCSRRRTGSFRRSWCSSPSCRDRPVHHHLQDDVHPRASTESDRFHESFWRSRDIEQIYKQAQALRNSPLSQMFVAGYTELAKLASDEDLRGDPRRQPLQHRARAAPGADRRDHEARVDGAVPRHHRLRGAVHRLVRTVIGILLAFLEISEAEGAATLKVVGPHIAEALFATAIGLVAAIPRGDGVQLLHAAIRVLRSEMGDLRARLSQHHQASLPALRCPDGDEQQQGRAERRDHVTPLVGRDARPPDSSS